MNVIATLYSASHTILDEHLPLLTNHFDSKHNQECPPSPKTPIIRHLAGIDP